MADHNGYPEQEVDGNTPSVPGAMLPPNNDEDARILKAMDRLRELGIDQDYDLPQIIVVGSQSAGKSSVLESLVQVPFPRSENTCTKYVTKVTILPAAVKSVEVRIDPDPDRPDVEVKRLKAFKKKEAHTEDFASRLGQFMSEANREIFTGSAERALVTKDVLLVTIFAPGSRPLQVLDLPGLIAYDQRASGNDTAIEDMVKKHMAMKHSMILAVIKATEDLNNQKILKLCKEHDPEGQRTLGVITRPDVAETHQIEDLIRVVQGQHENFQFNHDWHVIRNRTSQELDSNISQEERDLREMELFTQLPWNKLDSKSWGIVELRARLREMLFSVAKKELPNLREKLSSSLRDLKERFNNLGGDDIPDEELERVFERAITCLQNAARDHARGKYESDIRKFDGDDPVHLRSRIVEEGEVFRDKLVENGHAWITHIRPVPRADPDSDLGSVFRRAEKTPPESSLKQDSPPDLEAEIADVVRLLNQLRGTTLPTFHEPKRISQLFWRMSDGWNTISKSYVYTIYTCCKTYFKDITPVAFKRKSGHAGPEGFSNAEKIAERFVDPIIVPKLRECREKALNELEKLEQDRLDILINADVRFLKDRRSHREDREYKRVMRAHREGELSSEAKGGLQVTVGRLDQVTYARRARLHTQQELTEVEADTFLDAMWSHYLIEREIYITNVLRQVVERHFLRHLEELVPKRFELEDIKCITKNDTDENARKKKIKDDMDKLENSLEALDGIR